MGTWAAVVLAGGTSRRMGSDKLAAEVAGTALLDRVLAAVAHAEEVVAVGPARTTAYDVTWVREDPPGGGPGAAVAAGLAALRSAPAVVALLAGDLPLVDRRTVDTLRGHGRNVVALDADGREQTLLGTWLTADLRAAVARQPALEGLPLRRLLEGVPRTGVRLGTSALDCDTPEELALARALAAQVAGDHQG